MYNTLRVSITYMYYNIDPVGFIEALCENKDKPELQCNGKCHLKKVIESNQNQEKAPVKIIDFKYLLCYGSLITNYNFTINTILNPSVFRYFNHYKYLIINYNFRPPVA